MILRGLCNFKALPRKGIIAVNSPKVHPKDHSQPIISKSMTLCYPHAWRIPPAFLSNLLGGEIIIYITTGLIDFID